MGFHKSGEANKELPTQDVFFSLFFSGRLSTTGRISRGHGKSLVSSPKPFQEAGVLDQREEILHYPQPEGGILGSPFPFRLTTSSPSTEESAKNSRSVQTDGSEVSGLQASIRNTPGPFALCFVTSTSREASTQTSSNVDEHPHFAGFEGHSSNCGNVLQTGTGNLAGPRFPAVTSTHVATAPFLRA